MSVLRHIFLSAASTLALATGLSAQTPSVVMPTGKNTEASLPNLAVDGFQISVDGMGLDGKKVAGAAADRRRYDLDLAAHNLRLKVDALAPVPMLNVSTQGTNSAVQAGQSTRFLTYTNYRPWIDRAELRIVDATNGQTVDTIAVDPGGSVSWRAAANLAGRQLEYRLRVYDRAGRFDETGARPLAVVAGQPAPHAQTGSVLAAGYGEDFTQKRGITLRGGAVTVTGDSVPKGGTVMVAGRAVPVDANGRFATQMILPAGTHSVPIELAGAGQFASLTRPVDIPGHDTFYVGIVDLTFSRDTATGQAATTRSTGRLAFYVKSQLDPRSTITAALDTTEEDLGDVFSNLYRKDPRGVLDRLDPDDFYPVYGDDSTAEQTAPTAGRFYLRYERDASHVMWGNFATYTPGTELLRNDRQLYGASAAYISPEVTTQGDRRTEITAYFAQPDTLPQQDQMRGTGGSAYFLQREDINQGSETLAVETRDPLTGQVTSRRVLTPGQDFTVDYIQGVVLLTSPLGAQAGGSSIVGSTGAPGDDVFLVAQYEYSPTLAATDGFAKGARAQHWVTDNLRLGATFQRENTGISDQRVEGVDLRYKLSERSFVAAELARTTGPGFGRSLTTDGGLTYTGQNTAGLFTQATGYDVTAALDLADLGVTTATGSVSANVRHRDAGFSTLLEDVSKDQDSYLLAFDIAPSETLSFSSEIKGFDETGGRRETQATVEASWRATSEWELGAGLYALDHNDPAAAASKNGQRTDIGVRITRHFGPDAEVFGFAKATVSRSGGIARDNRLGIGGATRISEKLTLGGEISDGTAGLGAEASLTYAPTADDSYYLSYRLDPGRDPGGVALGNDTGTFVIGAKRRHNEWLSSYGESTYDGFGQRRSFSHSYGVQLTPNAADTVSIGFEAGQIEDAVSGDFDRLALSAGMTHASETGWSWRLRGEARLEDGAGTTRDRQTYLLSAGASYKVNPNWRFIADIDALMSDSDQSSVLDGDYVEASVGYALRPVDNERLNMLAKYTFLWDQAGSTQITAAGNTSAPQQRSHIFSIDADYDLNNRWSIGGKYGLRIAETAPRGSSTWTDATAQLFVLRADYHVVHNWDISVEARALSDRATRTNDTGLSAAVYRHFGNNMKVGVGYDTGRFDDDLRNVTTTQNGLFLNVIGKF